VRHDRRISVPASPSSIHDTRHNAGARHPLARGRFEVNDAQRAPIRALKPFAGTSGAQR
jgi:hypothetical protein